MRRSLIPAALAVVLTTTLVGCGGGVVPTPSPTATETPSATPTTPVVEESDEPTTVEALPAFALLRVSVTAAVGGEEVRMQLTFERPASATTAESDLAAVAAACPNAIADQLAPYPGAELIGVITSELTTTGDWPDGFTAAISAGGLVASIGDGSVAPSVDPPGSFGCSVPLVTGPGTSRFISALRGSPDSVVAGLDEQMAQGRYGISTDPDSQLDVVWKDCVVQLSSIAEFIALRQDWVLPAEWGDGCLIGGAGAV